MEPYNRLKERFGEDRLSFAEPMKRHTTFQTGGPADVFFAPESPEEFREAVLLCKELSLPYFVVGNGSNLLVSDEGYRGVILSTGRLTKVQVTGEEIQAGAGTKLTALSQAAMKNSLTGLEFAGGIPGTLGGAVYMNAGAYGGEMKQVLTEALILTEEGELLWKTAEELELGYRQSALMEKGWIALSARIRLAPGDKESIASRMEELAIQRKTKQPLEYPSAGSTFKRPEGYFAGKLIQDAGLAGFRVGGACVSPKHCGFVVNDQGATSGEIYRLCQEVEKAVLERYGVKLAMEVKILGDFC